MAARRVALIPVGRAICLVVVFGVTSQLGCKLNSGGTAVRSSISAKPEELIPFEGILERMAVHENRLVIVTLDAMYAWDWVPGSRPSRLAAYDQDKAVILGSDIVYLKGRENMVLAIGEHNGETRRLHTFGPNWYAHEGVWTRDGKAAMFHMKGSFDIESDDPEQKHQKLYGLRSDSDGARLLMVYENPLPDGGDVDIWTIGISDDGRYAVAAGIRHPSRGPSGGWFSIVDVAAGKEHASMTLVKGETVFGAVAFSPDSRWLYVGGTMGRLYRVSVETGEIEGRTYIGKSPKSRFGHRLMEIAVSPDGSVVAAGSGPKGEIYFWDAVTLERITTLWTKDGTTQGMVFSPDGTKLATYGAYCEDGIRIWDVSFLAGRKREAGQ